MAFSFRRRLSTFSMNRSKAVPHSATHRFSENGWVVRSKSSEPSPVRLCRWFYTGNAALPSPRSSLRQEHGTEERRCTLPILFHQMLVKNKIVFHRKGRAVSLNKTAFVTSDLPSSNYIIMVGLLHRLSADFFRQRAKSGRKGTAVDVKPDNRLRFRTALAPSHKIRVISQASETIQSESSSSPPNLKKTSPSRVEIFRLKCSPSWNIWRYDWCQDLDHSFLLVNRNSEGHWSVLGIFSV